MQAILSPALSALPTQAPASINTPAVRSPGQTVWLLALWLAGPGNLPLWQRMLSGGEVHWTAFMGLGLMILGGTAALLSLLAWPRLLRPVASLLVVMAALNSHYMWQYGVVIDTTMLANALHTDAREVRDLLSWSLMGSLLLVAAPALGWLWHRPVAMGHAASRLLPNGLGAVAGLVLAVGAALLSYQDLASLMRNQKTLRFMINPLNTVYAAGKLAAQQLPAQVRTLTPVGEDAVLGASYANQARPPLLLLVLGETARADRFALDGYGRDTTPVLARWQQQGDLVNFSQVRSCGTNTQVSVPCVFSPLTRAQGGDETARHENLLDVLQRAGLAVLWLDNQAGCKGVCDRVPNASTRGLDLPGLCSGGECFDEVMLQDLDARIAALDPQRRERGVVLVMHQMGSHGPAYFKRTPPEHKRFVPECTSATLSDCTPESLANAYDNTIAYTDHFLGQTLDWLQRQAQQGRHDTGLVYVSDHGESLGENGLYLHGLPYALAPEQQTHVPMVAWLSPGLQRRSGVSVGCLRQRSGEALSHDNVFHSVLGLMDVRTSAYQRPLDALAPCAKPPVQAGVSPRPAG
ncbi:phosphoethanolamine--lipid A transferase [Hydrogenophaga aromaticivorans]|uniref:phosphoethanolamine transferase n=1 Tax=Hydrogenophaga aromaticivorans TaxID=2610898 RepID=UPI001B36892F|nr:phosphoethanolamine--lipid A transferase [Hydrogenophaga aromaticivorans]MBQ0920031.1 phosphoethanolamine--lipid A transferase [Hydrogenophaga aromaticivorans]